MLWGGRWCTGSSRIAKPRCAFSQRIGVRYPGRRRKVASVHRTWCASHNSAISFSFPPPQPRGFFLPRTYIAQSDTSAWDGGEFRCFDRLRWDVNHASFFFPFICFIFFDGSFPYLTYLSYPDSQENKQVITIKENFPPSPIPHLLPPLPSNSHLNRHPLPSPPLPFYSYVRGISDQEPNTRSRR